MITETGKIIAIKEKGAEQDAETVVIVECISRSACSSCHNSSSCGVGTVAKAFSDKSHQFELPYKEGMQVDAFLELQIDSRDLIQSAILAYLVPLFFFIAGAVLTKQFYFSNEGTLILISVVCAAVGFLFTRFLSKTIFSKKPLNKIINAELTR